MKIEIGEYVRTKKGLIFKATEYWLSELTEEIKENIKKHSKNIIDLIEDEDIVILEYKSPRYYFIDKKFLEKALNESWE